MAACIALGYQNVYGMEYGAAERSYVRSWSSSVRDLFDVKSNIGDALADKPGAFAFIHLSHVIEHIPKYSLLYVTDALYRSLSHRGTLFLRTPNMEGPCAMSSLYCTLDHEYGFSGMNLKGLLELCNFDNVKFHELRPGNRTLKQRLGSMARESIISLSRVKHRLFGVNVGGSFGAELIVSAQRFDRPALFDAQYR